MGIAQQLSRLKALSFSRYTFLFKWGSTDQTSIRKRPYVVEQNPNRTTPAVMQETKTQDNKSE